MTVTSPSLEHLGHLTGIGGILSGEFSSLQCQVDVVYLELGSLALGSKGGEGGGHKHHDLYTVSGPEHSDWITWTVLEVEIHQDYLCIRN